MKTPIVDLLNETVPHLIAWCTPSILRTQRQVVDIYTSGMSISYEEKGNPEEPPWRASSGIFGEAYQLAAQAYWGEQYQSDTHHCVFSVNGSTGSNFMIMKALKLHLRDKLHILAQRNVHKSIIDASDDYQVKLSFLKPNYHPDYQVFIPNRIDDFVQQVQADSSINVVMLSNPTYDGFSIDLPKLISALRAIRPNLIIYIDEAWGSNFYFDPATQPTPACHSGADIVVLSTHKQGGALQQTGLILWRDAPYMLSKDTMFYAYRSLLTTSPSWHLLASIDASRAYMQQHGEYALRHVVDIAEHLRTGLKDLLHCVTPEDLHNIGSVDVAKFDQTKLLFDTYRAGVSGKVLASLLEQHHIIPEKSEHHTLLLLVPFQRTIYDADETVRAIRYYIEASSTQMLDMLAMPNVFKKIKEPAEVGGTELVSLDDGVGRICAENITPYPPGIPLIIKGEQVLPEQIEYIQHLNRIGSTVLMYDSDNQYILVECQ